MMIGMAMTNDPAEQILKVPTHSSSKSTATAVSESETHFCSVLPLLSSTSNTLVDVLPRLGQAKTKVTAHRSFQKIAIL